ncbi:MAG: PA14 domain-containing protein, partial [Pirellula sp.]
IIRNISDPVLMFGDSNLALARGNRVFGNGGTGVLVSGNVQVAGNTIYGHLANNAFGVSLSGGATASNNVVFGNSSGATILGIGNFIDNRVYNNTNTGLLLSGTGGIALRNVIYSNNVGIEVGSSNVRNNLVYDNTLRGVSIDGTSAQFVNNTVHQQASEAIRIQQSSGLLLRNNIFWADGVLGNVAMLVTSSGQTGFAADYNAFLVTNSAGVGQWGGVRYMTLAGFQVASQSNPNSLSLDPMFVNPLGADGVIGYVNAAQDGRDDDLHEKSLFGSFHGGSFAPAATGGTGLPQSLTGSWVLDAVQSPAIDSGNPTDSFANEPLDNGNVINLGAYGNTVQASKSPAAYVQVLAPNGGEVWLANQTFNIRWGTHNLNAPAVTYSIDLMRQGNPIPVLNIAAAAAGTGLYPWTVPTNLTPANDYFVRITQSGSGLADDSNSPFSIAQQVSVYYVNDGTLAAGDWTTVVGNDANNGLSPSTPKATIQAVLASYDLGPSDRIRVDAGTYTLDSDVTIAAADGGITIEGYHDLAFPTRKTVINRNNLSRPAFELQNADNVTFEYLEITAAGTGILALAASDSDDLVVRNSRFISVGTGVSLATTNDRVLVANSHFDGVAGYTQRHVILSGVDSVVENNFFTRGGTGGNSSSGSIMVTGVRSMVRDNEIVDDRAVSGSIFISTGFTTEADRVVIRNNTIRDTLTNGLFGGSGTLIENNTLTNINNVNNPGSVNPTHAINSTGIVRGNSISNSQWALNGAGLFEDNRVFNNERGITSTSGGRYIRNQIYDNLVAVQVEGTNPVFRNNVIYRNDSGFILGSQGFGSSAIVENNTIYQPTGNAIEWVNLNSSATLRNNIFWVASGRAFEAPDGGLIPSSDYNQFYLTGTGSLANYGGQTYSDPDSWYYALGYDKNSRLGDPLFVDIDGADNTLGYDRGNGLLGSYFNNTDLSGGPVLQRTERVDLGAFSSPGPGVNADNFSARWEGFIHIPAAGDYTFYVSHNDGIRLFFDNTLRINQWVTVTNSTEYNYTATGLAAGWYPIKVEMRELTGFAEAKLRWQGPGIAKQVV